MNEASPAVLLREAAQRMRERAAAATPGPWWSDDSEECWRLHGVAFRIGPQINGLIPEQVVNKQILKAPKTGTPYAEYWPDPADAEWITSMNPVFGSALAEWLEDVAKAAAESLIEEFAECVHDEPCHCEHPRGWACEKCLGWLGDDCHCWDKALAVASAYLVPAPDEAVAS